MVKVGRPPQDPARQLERAHRILDAAAELILRWGYDKTTVDDVARQAAVAKGTIYLHWRTRDALFAALLRRERVELLEEVRRAAPETLRDLIAGLAGAVLRRPLMKALLLGDSEVLGKLNRQKRESPTTPALTTALDGYLATLAAHGVLRGDLAPTERLTVVGSVLYGFLMTQGTLPEPLRTPDDRLVELIADTVDRTLGMGTPADAGPGVDTKITSATEATSDAGGTGDTGGMVARATRDYLATVEGVARAKLALSLGLEERVT